jgi:putative colanic acid biosynthesis acetyltransferase WcaF
VFGAKIGKNVLIKPKVNIKYPWFLKMGDNISIGENVWIDNLAMVIINSNVVLSQGSMLLCGNHNYKKISFDLIIGEINIEDGVWIGAQSIVCPGITCKSHSILTVGSVATRDLDGYSIYQGIPAVKTKNRIID